MDKFACSFAQIKLRRRLIAAVALITFFPLLVVGYYFSGFSITNAVVVIIFSLIFLGWWVMFEIFKAVEEICKKSQTVAREVGISNAYGVENEVQQLDLVFNALSDKVKQLTDKINELSLVDAASGIYNEKFFLSKLTEEIQRAIVYQRPCGLIVLKLDKYSEYKQQLTAQNIESIFKKVITAVKGNIRPIDILGRLTQDSLGIVVVEHNRRQSQYLGGKLKEAIVNVLKVESDIVPAVSIAVAENPIDGTDAESLKKSIEQQFNSQSG